MLSRPVSHIILSFAAFQAVLSFPLADSQQRSSNGLALTPPMGWNSYNHYTCEPSHDIVISNAKAVIDLGLKAAGYHYITIDCGWTLPTRADNGTLQWNVDRFPYGPYALANYMHDNGLGFGIYSDGGIQMCMTGTPAQAGSLNYEQVDAESFASIGADLLKYDNCYSDAATGYPMSQYTPIVSPSAHYVTMSKALAATGRKILFQICDWGVNFPSAWAPNLGNTWRVTNDIVRSYQTIPRILNQVVPQTSFAGPGHWLDLDMLEVGNNIWTTPEEQTHFSLWAILKSPLIIGAALKDNSTSISAASLDILKNPSVISYNQDSLGVAASFRRRWTEEGYEVWAGPLSGGRTIATVINLFDEPREITLDFPDIGLQSAGVLKEVWNYVSVNKVLGSYSAFIQAHGTMLLELQDTTSAGYYDSSFASTSGTQTTYSPIYGVTSSDKYSLTITFSSTSKSTSTVTISSANQDTTTHTLPPNTKTLTVPISLNAENGNTIIITSPITPSTLNVQEPLSTFYPSTAFILSGSSTLTTCAKDLCDPVGKKLGFLSPTGSASISLSAPSSPSQRSASQPVPKYLNLHFCNNDIAFATAFTTGTNTRNLTLSLNGRVPVRVELPLSGRSSELYSPGLGWQDTGVFGVLLAGWNEGGVNELVVGNVGGGNGVQSFAADVVGVEVFW